VSAKVGAVGEIAWRLLEREASTKPATKAPSRTEATNALLQRVFQLCGEALVNLLPDSDATAM
jgi:hypothetical protein